MWERCNLEHGVHEFIDLLMDRQASNNKIKIPYRPEAMRLWDLFWIISKSYPWRHPPLLFYGKLCFVSVWVLCGSSFCVDFFSFPNKERTHKFLHLGYYFNKGLSCQGLLCLQWHLSIWFVQDRRKENALAKQ